MDNEANFEGRKRGRPKTGKNTRIDFRFPPTLIEHVRQYAAREFMSEGEAWRTLVQRGLDDEGN